MCLWVCISFLFMKEINVVAAIIEREGRYLICQRPEDKALGGKWEFVGGKIERGETPQQALVRECREEMAMVVEVGELFEKVSFDYGDRLVHLHFFFSKIVENEPILLEHSAMAWTTPEEMKKYDFCPADRPVVEKLCEISR